MTILKQKILKKSLIISGFLLFVGLFFIPQGIFAASVFTAGWYEDLGTAERDASCPDGNWRASIELINDLGEPILADKITIRAVWYEEGKDVGISIYSIEAVNLATSTFETDCAIPVKSSGTMALEVTAVESGYYTIRADNNYRTCSWDTFNKRKWKKILHLASLERTESPNVVYSFPEDNQWISARPEHSEMKIWVNNAPLPDNITQVDSEIIHMSSAEKFNLSQATNIASGEVTSTLPALTKHGYYTWRVKLARSSPSVLYNENAISRFNFDPNPPTVENYSGRAARSGKLQAPNVYAYFNDEPLPSSGVCKVEIYLNDGPDTPLKLVKTCSSSYCSHTGEYKEYTESVTYTYYAIGYDCVGNERKLATRSFTISQISPSYLRIRSSVNSSSVTGVPFEVTDVYNIVPEDEGKPGIDYPATGTSTTNKDFEGTVDQYTVTLQATSSHNGRPFSFWMHGSFCYTNPLTRTMYYNYRLTYTMHFGVSRLMIYRRYLANTGSMSDDLRSEINQIRTRIEQTGGSPSNFLSSSGYIDRTGTQVFYKTVTGEINDLRLKFHDSEDGILKFSRFYGTFCQTIDGPECQGSLIYECKTLSNYYAINRTVRVEVGTGAGGGIPVEGVSITGTGGMQSGTTTAEGYYAFSSTAQPSSFSGWLWAPKNIIDNNGDEVEFGYWTGCQSVSTDGLGCYIGTGVTWFYTINATVKAHYTSEADPGTPFLYVERDGNGTITDSEGKICCGCPSSVCSAYFAEGTPVTLTATPAADSYFVGWTAGDCFGTNPVCNLTMDSDRYTQAKFLPKPVLTVNITGTGDGTVDSNPSGIACPGTCSTYFAEGTPVTLTATPAADSYFVGWTAGDCSGTNPVCNLTMDSDRYAQAEFLPKPVLTVNVTGIGTVTSTPEEIVCLGPSTCSAYFNRNESVSLTAAATSGWEFIEWTGACTSTLPDGCSPIIMDTDKTVNALFEHIGPTAAMECYIEPTACKGPGCVCSNVLPLPVWQTFRGVAYGVKNMSTSTDLDRYITRSSWEIRDSNANSLVFGDPCPSAPLCDITIQPTIVTGNYNIILEVEDDQGITSSISHQIKIKEDIDVDFLCSLEEGGVPQSCSDINPLVGQTVYFTGSATSSEADVPTSIISWDWKKGREGESEADFSQFSYGSSTASTTLTTAINRVTLIVRDDHPGDGSYSAGRQASTEPKTLKVALPLPEYRPISPAVRQDSFLAKIINIFR